MANSTMTTMMPRTIQPDMEAPRRGRNGTGAAGGLATPPAVAVAHGRRRLVVAAGLSVQRSLIIRGIDVGAKIGAGCASIGTGHVPELGRVVAPDVAGRGIRLRGVERAITIGPHLLAVIASDHGEVAARNRFVRCHQRRALLSAAVVAGRL